MNVNRRVVVTGMGIISPLGNDIDTYWGNLLAGKSGIGHLTRFEPGDMPSRIAGEVKDFAPEFFGIDPKVARRLDLYTQYALASAIAACKQAKIEKGSLEPTNAGVLIGSGIGGIDTLLTQHSVLLEKGHRRVSPFLIPMMISDIASAYVAIEFDLRGPNFATVSACASGAHAIGESFVMIKDGRADVMITGGAEAPLLPLAFAGFCAARALSTRNDDPTTASRPFDKDRDGFVMSEGAGVLVLEELEHAKNRGAEILAEVVGYCATGDAYHITAPHPDGLGAKESMLGALKSAGLSPSDVEYINTHGTSTDVGDVAEAKAIRDVFGDRPWVNSTKSMIGHLLGAAGAVELIATIKTLQTGWIHPSINIFNLEPQCEGIKIAREPVKADPKIALSNSFGFGGHNATIVLKKWE